MTALVYLGTQQVFYATNDLNASLRHAYRGGGAWGYEYLDGPSSSYAAKTSSSPAEQISATVVGNDLHVFASFRQNYIPGTTSGLRHIWYSGSTWSWSMVWFGTGFPKNLTVTEYLGGYSLSTVDVSNPTFGSWYWGQGNFFSSSDTFTISPGFSTSSPVWIDSYKNGGGYLNVIMTYKSGSNSLTKQYWK